MSDEEDNVSVSNTPNDEKDELTEKLLLAQCITQISLQKVTTIKSVASDALRRNILINCILNRTLEFVLSELDNLGVNVSDVCSEFGIVCSRINPPEPSPPEQSLDVIVVDQVCDNFTPTDVGTVIVQDCNSDIEDSIMEQFSEYRGVKRPAVSDSDEDYVRTKRTLRNFQKQCESYSNTDVDMSAVSCGNVQLNECTSIDASFGESSKNIGARKAFTFEDLTRIDYRSNEEEDESLRLVSWSPRSYAEESSDLCCSPSDTIDSSEIISPLNIALVQEVSSLADGFKGLGQNVLATQSSISKSTAVPTDVKIPKISEETKEDRPVLRKGKGNLQKAHQTSQSCTFEWIKIMLHGPPYCTPGKKVPIPHLVSYWTPCAPVQNSSDCRSCQQCV